MKTAAFYLSLACLSFALSASAQTADISDDGLNGLQKKPKVIAAGDVAKNSKSITKGSSPGTPALKPGEMRFTKAARIVSQPDGSLVESPLVEIPVLFDQGKATLRADAVSQRNLRRLAEAILAIKDADARFTIGGFASAEGDGGANLKLSEDRASTVLKALMEMGVPQTVLKSEGYGTRFAVAKATEPDELRAKDRKVLAVRDK
jgi:OOP family OmpA-OmpF porin